jgi:hypothetical protein
LQGIITFSVSICELIILFSQIIEKVALERSEISGSLLSILANKELKLRDCSVTIFLHFNISLGKNKIPEHEITERRKKILPILQESRNKRSRKQRNSGNPKILAS